MEKKESTYNSVPLTDKDDTFNYRSAKSKGERSAQNQDEKASSTKEDLLESDEGEDN